MHKFSFKTAISIPFSKQRQSDIFLEKIEYFHEKIKILNSGSKPLTDLLITRMEPLLARLQGFYIKEKEN